MEIQKIEMVGMTVSIPDYYQKVKSEQGDPDNSIPFMVQTDNAMCLAFVYPDVYEHAIPQNEETLIQGVRQFLAGNQGLVEIATGNDYAYSIVKNLKQPSGIQYILTYQKLFPERIMCVQAYFDEIGTTGIRDNVVLNYAMQEGLIGSEDDPLNGWAKDPYDSSIREGALMNMSEDRAFDSMFPGFPLSMCRELVAVLING